MCNYHILKIKATNHGVFPQSYSPTHVNYVQCITVGPSNHVGRKKWERCRANHRQSSKDRNFYQQDSCRQKIIKKMYYLQYIYIYKNASYYLVNRQKVEVVYQYDVIINYTNKLIVCIIQIDYKLCIIRINILCIINFELHG